MEVLKVAIKDQTTVHPKFRSFVDNTAKKTFHLTSNEVSSKTAQMSKVHVMVKINSPS